LLDPGPAGGGLGRRERHVVRFAGADAEVDVVVVEYDAPRTIAWRMEELRMLGRTARREQVQSVRLGPEGEGTRVRVHVRVKPRGLSEQLMAPLTRRPTVELLDSTLDNLERLAAGDRPQPDEPPARGAPPFAAGIDVATLSLGLTVLTGVANVAMRTIADLFHAPLRLAPEDVGLGQAELLGRSVGLIAVALLVTLDLAVLAGQFSAGRWVRWLATLPLVAVWFLIGWFVESWIPQAILGLTFVVQITIAIVGMRWLMSEPRCAEGPQCCCWPPRCSACSRTRASSPRSRSSRGVTSRRVSPSAARRRFCCRGRRRRRMSPG
jgi:hypothetical protein